MAASVGPISVNEKMRCAAHTVLGNLRAVDSSHPHRLNVAFGPPVIANASGTEICAKAETAEMRVGATTQNIAQKITQNNSQSHTRLSFL
jgi:hypothetical protein